ncbi:MAG: response regulator transcription factor [Alphaproteobacteria bacterium]|nr:response regulator transcription factor [Alphaproteobacteria bacterium]
MPRVLLIEDDSRLAAMVGDYLRANGMSAAHAGDGEAALRDLRAQVSDVILLDLMLPDGDGLDLFKRIRDLPDGRGAVPVIMVTARGDPMDRVIGLEVGADDYLPKPFEPRELLARIRAVLRRAGAAGAPAADILRFGRLEIDRGARMARIDGEEAVLTSHQFALLLAMAERPGRVLSREQLMEFSTGEAQDYDPAFDRSVDVHIARIRAALEDDPKAPRRIITVRGAGYVFARTQDAHT